MSIDIIQQEVLPPFDSAMNQAQFEATREQNKDEFAASGFVHFGKHYHAANSEYIAINEGLWTNTVAPNNLQLGKSSAPAPLGKSKSGAPVVHVAGTVFTLSMIGQSADSNQNQIKFPQAPDGKTTYNKATGVTTTYATATEAFNAQAADPTNVEVVTDRVDMWGFEAFLEEVNTTNPYVYPNGLIQSQAATMDGITTSASNRPVTYYAVFDGDTGSKGKGVNFFTLSEAQKRKVLSNHKNNLYFLDDGRLVQWRLRQRTIAGAGNGDWFNIESQKGNLQFKSGNTLNSSLGSPLVSDSTNIGVFKDSLNSYFLVCGTVNRLNQGAYHLSFNPSGSKVFWRDSGGASNPWHQVAAIPNTARCFDMSKSWNSADNAGYPRPDSGNIGAAAGSGRPDGRLYDAIYASGQGGVCRDMRYSANGVDSVCFAEADQQVKNGTYRGFEKQVFSKVTKAIPSNSLNGLLLNKDNSIVGWISGYTPKGAGSGLGFSNEAKVYVVLDGVVIAKGRLSQPERVHSDGSWYAIVYWDTDGVPANTTYACTNSSFLIIQDVTSSSVGGSFLQTDVIGNPAHILATPQLANGWQGSWGGLSGGGGVLKTGTRKMIASGLLTYSSDNGATWNTGQLPQPNAENEVTRTYSESEIRICQYQAFAKQTENAANAPVYGGASGVSKVVDVQSWFDIGYGTTLVESCLGKILTNSNGNSSVVVNEGLAVTSITFDPNCGLHWYRPSQLPNHGTLNLGSPLGSSLAFKALNYNVILNQQANIQYAYTELKYNGSNWGDDGKVTIVDNQTTKTDLNGNTVLVGTAKLKEPIGWIKLKV